MTITSFIVLAFITAQLITAINVGCFYREKILNGATGIYVYDGPIIPEVPCNCAARGYDYTWRWSQYGGVGTRDTCFCTNTTPSFQYMLNNQDYCTYPGMLYKSDASVDAVATRVAGWFRRRCINTNTRAVGSDVTDVYKCIAQCQSAHHRYLAFVSHRRSAKATCVCLDNLDIPNDNPRVGCGWESWIILENTASQQGSVVKRHHTNMHLPYNVPLCPAGTVACSHGENDHSGAIECIDTSSELESCGGCIYGEMTSNGSLPATGTNCNSLPGISPSGVACSGGRCVTDRCEDGFHLEVDQCVPSNN